MSTVPWGIAVNINCPGHASDESNSGLTSLQLSSSAIDARIRLALPESDIAVSVTKNALEHVQYEDPPRSLRNSATSCRNLETASNTLAKTRPKEFAVLPKKEPRLPLHGDRLGRCENRHIAICSRLQRAISYGRYRDTASS